MNRWLLVLLPLLLVLPTAHAERLIGQPGEPVQPLIDRAGDGDEIHLPAGVYPGRLLIHRSLHLRGEPGAVIDAGGEGDAIRVRASAVTVEGLNIRNWGSDIGASNAGIFAERSAGDLRILDNFIQGVGFGIWLDGTPGARVERNRVQGDASVRSQERGNGIHLYNVTGAEIIGNEVWHARDGLYIGVSNHNVLRDNRLYDLRYGVHYMFSMDNRIENNHTTRTRTGYALMQSKRLTVIGNVSEQDQNYGLLMNNITHSLISGNRVIDVRSGGSDYSDAHVQGAEGKAVFVYNAQFNELSHNTFADSAIGIHLTAGAEDNHIFGNAFLANYTQVKYVATRQQEWSRDGRGNYWSDYLGWDLDGDGVGDTAYQPNDAIDQLLWRHPQAKILMHSPAVQTLRWAQQQFPVFRPPGVKDSAPLMQAPNNDNGGQP